MHPLWYEVRRLSSNKSAKAEKPECQTSMSLIVVFCVDPDISKNCKSILVTYITRKRYQVTCRVVFLGLVLTGVLDFSDPFH